ncbi:hypothetical protein Daus18300_002557 [Diaporthe australafricana]|uniref:Peptidase S8/S53 domain-containing protein n=1 Tax=Diaporthe australafricana TaxID=127596 RepID=A0ABR3XMG4_9PEZI
MSVGVEPHSRSMNDVARDMFNEGIFVAVSAGNKGKNTNSTSPASEPSICTVGATDSNNQMAEFSNVGPVVDILAPGVDVLSASNENTTASLISSGTSMAAPHVAGLAACLLASGHKDPKTLCEYMAKTASPLRTVVSNDTISLVAFNGNPEG